MMTRSIPITALGGGVSSLPEELLQERDLGVVAVTREGQPVLAILPWELYTVIIETLCANGSDTAPADKGRGPRPLAIPLAPV